MSRVYAGALIALLLACGPIKPNPDPKPTPTPTPLPTPTPTPKPPCDGQPKCGDGTCPVGFPPCPVVEPPVCLPPSRIDLAYRPPAGGSRPIVDATPKVVGCDACLALGFPQGQCVCPLGPEGSNQRAICEAQAAPYTWTVNATPCVPNGQCWLNNGNILQVVLCQASTGGCTPGASGDVVATTAAAGATGSLTLP